MHFEKVGDNYQLAFSKGEYSSANWIIEGLAAWVKKRDELQPDINDSNSTIADKKNDYIRWKQDIHIILPKRLPAILHWFRNLMKMPLLCYLLAGNRLLASQSSIAACLR